MSIPIPILIPTPIAQTSPPPIIINPVLNPIIPPSGSPINPPSRPSPSLFHLHIKKRKRTFFLLLLWAARRRRRRRRRSSKEAVLALDFDVKRRERRAERDRELAPLLVDPEVWEEEVDLVAADGDLVEEEQGEGSRTGRLVVGIGRFGLMGLGFCLGLGVLPL